MHGRLKQTRWRVKYCLTRQKAGTCSLEAEFAAQLQGSRPVVVRDLAEIWVVTVHLHALRIDVVERVVGLEAQVQMNSLTRRKRNRLEDGDIPVLDSGPLDGVLGSVAEALVGAAHPGRKRIRKRTR